MSFKKDIIKDAIVDAKAIEKFAMESAKKAIEESIAPQIEKVVLNSIKEIEALNESEIENSEEVIEEPVVEEGIKLDIAPDADLTINVSAEGASIEVGGDTNTIDNSNPEPEMNNTPEMHEDELFEIEGLSEEDAAMAPVAPAANPGDAIAEPAAEGDIESKLADLTSKIDQILAAVNPTGDAGQGAVDIVDDDATGAPAQAAPAPAPAPQPTDIPVNEDDIMFEIEDDMDDLFEFDVVTEDSIDEINLSELESIDEIEIVDEDEDVDSEEESVDEMRGVSNTVQRSAGNRKNFQDNNMKHTPVHVNEGVENIKAQYESTIDELKQENESLKEAVEKVTNENKEYKDAFVGLRQQVNEMQIFNGKLAYANRLLTTGGITADEKIKIAEAFDKAETIEEAKKLYNKLIAEMNVTKGSISPVSRLKATAKPQIIQQSNPSQTEAIYESEERKRMKLLAGIRD